MPLERFLHKLIFMAAQMFRRKVLKKSLTAIFSVQVQTKHMEMKFHCSLKLSQIISRAQMKNGIVHYFFLSVRGGKKNRFVDSQIVIF